MKLTNRNVLITGGGSGIGLALARELLARGNTVIITGRDSTKLEQAQRDTPGLHAAMSDITREEEIRNLVTRIEAEYGGLDVLVNNAAILNFYDFLGEDDHFPLLEQEIATNLLGAIKMTRLALPLLLRRPQPAITIVSSAVAYVPVPYLPIYSATKAAVHSFAQSLRQQLARTSVKVFDVLPPTVDTGLVKEMNGAKLSVDAVAREIVHGLEHDTYEIRVRQVQALFLANRLSPALGARLMARETANGA